MAAVRPSDFGTGQRGRLLSCPRFFHAVDSLHLPIKNGDIDPRGEYLHVLTANSISYIDSRFDNSVHYWAM
jgi:hypothetical protein